LRSVQLAKRTGFDNITIDLIYGMPSLTNDRWKQNVETALSLNIPHLSCYALTVEPKTALEKMIASKKAENVDPAKQGCQFELLMRWMEEAGYEHYEISNFAKPGYRSKHNSSYWQGKHYLGLGPSAHSFNGYSRQWNISNNALYIKSIGQGIIPCETEELTAVQQLNEYIMTSLRTMEGLSLATISKKWNNTAAKKIRLSSKKFIQQEMMFEKDDNLMLTKKGRLFADGIAADLFVSSPKKSNIL
jgi:oxygen-independent coproporphyrinogen III oxidase